MAGTSMKDIKSRIKSVGGTMQITKAMELVATSKLRRAKEKLEQSRPFYETLRSAISTIESSSDVQDSVWSSEREINRTLYIVIAGDRGLAGGYNANIFRLADELRGEGPALYLPIGKKAIEHCKHRGYDIYSEAYGYVADISVGDTFAIAESVCGGFSAGEFDKVVLVYTVFDSMLVQIPKHKALLPLSQDSEQHSDSYDPIFDGDPEEMLEKIVCAYIGGVLYSGVCESTASELGARRTAMDAANKNASEIIDTLMLQYNRARQAVITQEITEIVSGSEAL